MRTFLLLASLISASAVESAETGNPKASCSPIEKLESRNGGCRDNESYLRAGVGCFRALDETVQGENKLLTAVLAVEAQAAAGQAGSLDRTGFDLNVALAALQKLEENAHFTRDQLQRYSKSLYFPDDFDAPPSLIGKPSHYLRNSPCYAEPHRQLLKLKIRTADYIGKISRAKTAIITMNAAVSGQKHGLESTGSVAANPTNEAKKTTTPRPAGKSKEKSSTITGKIPSEPAKP